MQRGDIFSTIGGIIQQFRRRNRTQFTSFISEEEIDNGQYIDTLQNTQSAAEGGISDNGQEMSEISYSENLRLLPGPSRREANTERSERIGGASFNGKRRRPFGNMFSVANETPRLEAVVDDRQLGSVRRTLQKVMGHVGKREIIRSVAFYRSNRELREILEVLSKPRFRNQGPNIRLIGVHPENSEETCGHIHIYHDCNPNHGQCRCVFLQGVGPIQYAKGTVWTRDFSEDDLLRIFLYLSNEERYTSHIIVGDRQSGRRTIASQSTARKSRFVEAGNLHDSKQ